MTELETKYITDVRQMTPHSRRLGELFCTIPEMKSSVYKRTAIIYATEEYERAIARGETIPHGFFKLLDDGVNIHGTLTTINRYEREIKLIVETMGLDLLSFKKNIMKLKHDKRSLAYTNEEQTARHYIQEIIRKFTSKYKENYIKHIIEEKTKELESNSVKTKKGKKKRYLSLDDFINYVFNNPSIKNGLKTIIAKKFNIEVTDEFLRKIIIVVIKNTEDKKGYIGELSEIFEIQEPFIYQYFEANKPIIRLERTFAHKLNEEFANATPEEKEAIIKILEYKVKCHKLHQPQNSEEFNKLKALIKKTNLSLLEEISTVMIKADATVSIVDGEFVFNSPNKLSNEEIEICSTYHMMIANIKAIHNSIYKLYTDQDEILRSFETENEIESQDEEDYIVTKEKWLNSELIHELIEKIDIKKINNMTSEAFTALKKFLIKDGLLWAYIAGNISIEDTSKIIENFQAIYESDKNLIAIENIQEIIKKAHLYDYVTDIAIGLLGMETLTKIINYNQYYPTTITKEVIEQRIRKVLDLSVRSESANVSSLPFNCDVRGENLTLQRYYNNDPAILTSGVDTKTCFFVCVDENDFFFYSILSKDGYVVRIIDNVTKELVARASCFRNNNVLMINGIRYVKGKKESSNQEESLLMQETIKLVRMMAKKMIELTSNDEVPIDYVICNKEGILEDAQFEDLFEMINSNLVRQPVNIYGDEWQRFIHLYDHAEEQMLTEVITDPTQGFKTDFGNHYPALLIASRDYRAFTSPRDIGLIDQEAHYRRPRRQIEEYIPEEINDEIIARINRIRALNCFIGTPEKVKAKKQAYRLINNIENLKKVVLGDDWCILIYTDNKVETIFATFSKAAQTETKLYIASQQENEEKGVKLYFSPSKNLNHCD